MAVKTKIEGDKFIILSPYDRNFITEIKKLGGKWRAPHWVVDIRQQERAEEILRDIYGEDGAADSSSDMVNVKLTGCEWNDSDDGSEWRLASRRIVSRASRDWAVQFGPGVVCVAGEFSRSGGSAKYPSVAPVDEGKMIFEVYDLPRAVYEKVKDREGVSLLTATKPVQDEYVRLTSEKEKLLARIKEIDARLAELEK